MPQVIIKISLTPNFSLVFKMRQEQETTLIFRFPQKFDFQSLFSRNSLPVPKITDQKRRSTNSPLRVV